MLFRSDGMDEISLSGATHIAELKDGKVREYTVQPQAFGLKIVELDTIRVANADEARTMLLTVLDNQPGAARDTVQLNAGAAIYVAGLSDTLEHGVKKAAEVIASGEAKNKLAQLIQISNEK